MKPRLVASYGLFVFWILGLIICSVLWLLGVLSDRTLIGITLALSWAAPALEQWNNIRLEKTKKS